VWSEATGMCKAGRPLNLAKMAYPRLVKIHSDGAPYPAGWNVEPPAWWTSG
jgi:hypothetical protein